MLNWEEIGSYLDRNIYYVEKSSFNFDYTVDCPDGTLLLIIFNNEFVYNHSNSNFLKSIITKSPLGVVFWGKGDELAWNKIIDLLSTNSQQKHIMTYLAYGETLFEAIEDTLVAKYPPDELYNEWVSYSILVIGGCDTNNKISIIQYLEERNS